MHPGLAAARHSVLTRSGTRLLRPRPPSAAAGEHNSTAHTPGRDAGVEVAAGPRHSAQRASTLIGRTPTHARAPGQNESVGWVWMCGWQLEVHAGLLLFSRAAGDAPGTSLFADTLQGAAPLHALRACHPGHFTHNQQSSRQPGGGGAGCRACVVAAARSAPTHTKRTLAPRRRCPRVAPPAPRSNACRVHQRGAPHARSRVGALDRTPSLRGHLPRRAARACRRACRRPRRPRSSLQVSARHTGGGGGGWDQNDVRLRAVVSLATARERLERRTCCAACPSARCPAASWPPQRCPHPLQRSKMHRRAAQRCAALLAAGAHGEPAALARSLAPGSSGQAAWISSGSAGQGSWTTCGSVGGACCGAGRRQAIGAQHPQAPAALVALCCVKLPSTTHGH